MNYNVDDLKNISRLLSGNGKIELPDCIKVDETALYECCYDMDWNADLLDSTSYNIDTFTNILLKWCKEDKFIDFINYYFNNYIDSKIDNLVSEGYSIFQMKDKILVSINALWSISDIAFEIALREMRRLSITMKESYHSWSSYDSVAYWAIDIIKRRAKKNDDINIEAANIIEYVASNVNRYDIKEASNILKNNSSIYGHIREQLSYHEGY